MSQPARQTEINRGTNWSVTAFNGEADMLESIRKGETTYRLPEWVKELHGGLEECPTSGKVHFQGYLRCRDQQRLSKVKKFLPTAHLEVATNKYALAQYAVKADTAVGEKTVTENNTYVDSEKAMRMLAEQGDTNSFLPDDHKDIDTYDFWRRVNKILLDKPYLVGLFSKPDIYRSWKNTKNVWFILQEKGTPP